MNCGRNREKVLLGIIIGALRAAPRYVLLYKYLNLVYYYKYAGVGFSA
jgi:hypothetical protein